MPVFSKGIPRVCILGAALAAFCLVPPEALTRGPNLCLWRHIFHLTACPACGTLRALAAFFHGHFAQALAFNGNVVITAPALVLFLLLDALHALRKLA